MKGRNSMYTYAVAGRRFVLDVEQRCWFEIVDGDHKLWEIASDRDIAMVAELDRLELLTGKWARAMRDALQPCRQCDYDEAEGDLYNHCPSCCHRVTSTAYEHFATEEARLAAEAAGKDGE